MFKKFNNKLIKNLKKFIQDKKFKKVFVITGKNSYFKSGANKIFDQLLLDKTNLYYFKKSFYPEINELKKIIRKIDIFKPDLVIAIGGGCVIDYSKIASVVNLQSNLSEKIIRSSFKMKKKNYKLLAIPTTAGSGAEVTSNAVLYVKKKKYSVEGSILKPDYFFLIPELIIGASKKIKASAGFDAISQSIESLISMKSNSRSVKYAQDSLKISFKYFVDYVHKPNSHNTLKMAIAANLSGRAISISKTTAPHALSYPFTAYYNISHGHAVSLTLNKCLNFNFKNLELANSNFDLKRRFNIIFKLAKVKNISELDNYLSFIKKKTGLESNFVKLGINIFKDHNRILSGVNSQRLKNNPVKLEKNDIYNILINKDV
tara:strand:+ start:927 stop:2048 length:1122 start_codon:yes stop_codon:yes gene_type:complete